MGKLRSAFPPSASIQGINKYAAKDLETSCRSPPSCLPPTTLPATEIYQLFPEKKLWHQVDRSSETEPIQCRPRHQTPSLYASRNFRAKDSVGHTSSQNWSACDKEGHDRNLRC